MHNDWIKGTTNIMCIFEHAKKPLPVSTPSYICDRFPGLSVAKKFHSTLWGIVHVESGLLHGGAFQTPEKAIAYIETYAKEYGVPDFSLPVTTLMANEAAGNFAKALFEASTVLEKCDECGHEIEQRRDIIDLGGLSFCRSCVKAALGRF